MPLLSKSILNSSNFSSPKWKKTGGPKSSFLLINPSNFPDQFLWKKPAPWLRNPKPTSIWTKFLSILKINLFDPVNLQTIVSDSILLPRTPFPNPICTIRLIRGLNSTLLSIESSWVYFLTTLWSDQKKRSFLSWMRNQRQKMYLSEFSTTWKKTKNQIHPGIKTKLCNSKWRILLANNWI